MKIIDAHVHTNFDHKVARAFAVENGIDFSWNGLRKEMKINGISEVLAITTSHHDETPGEWKMLIDQAKKDSRIKPVCAINPECISKKHLQKTEELMKNKQIFGIKIFSGYHFVYPNDKRYFQFYKLAGKYDVPVIFHTGDTFGSKYLVKYAHPLPIDEIAVQFRDTKFIIAHLGNPWVRDAAELVYKNKNVYADISAFCIGCGKKSPAYIFDDIRYAIEASESPDKLLYGSDWPLVSMNENIKTLKQAVPKKYHNLIFYKNAKQVFGL